MTMQPEFSRQYFCMTSDNYRDFSPWLYGWRLKNNMLQANCALPDDEDGSLSEYDDGGSHICISRDCKDFLRLTGDPIGYSTLWMYRKGGFWAISNSFYLLESVIRDEYQYDLTLNEGYAAQLLLNGAALMLPGQSLAQEIQALLPGVPVRIDLRTGALIVPRSRQENPADLLSEEGVAIVDQWINKWLGLLHGYAGMGLHFVCQVTGGFDSRNSLALLLNCGADISKVHFYCHEGVDLPIARQLATRGGFLINTSPTPPTAIQCKLSPELALHRHMISRGASHRGRAIKNEAWISMSLCLGGCSGELHRSTWCYDPLVFCLNEYPEKYGSELQLQAQKAFLSAVKDLEPLYRDSVFDLSRHPQDFMRKMYHLSKHRQHFGTAASQGLLANSFHIEPLADPLLLRVHQLNCPNHDTLFAFIMERIGGNLRYAPHESGRKFAPGAVMAARELNRRFPFKRNIGLERKLTLAAQPLRYESYDGNMEYADMLRWQVKQCLPVFNKHYSGRIGQEALAASDDEIFDTSAAHIPFVAKYLS